MIEIKVCKEFINSTEKLQSALKLLMEVEKEMGVEFEIKHKKVSDVSYSE